MTEDPYFGDAMGDVGFSSGEVSQRGGDFKGEAGSAARLILFPSAGTTFGGSRGSSCAAGSEVGRTGGAITEGRCRERPKRGKFDIMFW